MKKENYYDQARMEKYNSSNRSLEQREIKSLKLIQKFEVAKGAKFLDVGCGDGLFLQSVASEIGNRFCYYGGEYSEYQREKAKSRVDFNISNIDLEDGLDYEDSYFNFVYSGEVIEHLYNPDLMVSELSRILKSGGGCIITTPNMNSWVSRLLFLFGMQPVNYECSTVSSAYGYRWLKRVKRQDWPVGHVRLFNRHSLIDLLHANGFEVICIQGAVFEFIPKPIRWLDRFFANVPSLASGLVVYARKI